MTGADLRVIRKQVGWTQERMGKELGYSSNHMAQCEQGHRVITPRMERHVLILSHVSGLVSHIHELASLLGLLES